MSMSDPAELISSSRSNRRIDLDTSHGPLTVSFADTGCATGRPLLFMPGMFASRHLGAPMHVMAERAGVRLLVVDRPGMGASTDVPLAQRFDAWIDLLPRLLTYLDIPRVSLVAHSCGTTYLFNTWARCRELINSNIVLLAPWVDTAHSRMTTLQMAQYLPSKAFALWHKIPRFFVTQAIPVFASSGAVIRQMSPLSKNQAEEDLSFLDANWRRVERDYGVPHEQQAELARLAVRSMFDENTVGANSEALMCLRKGDGADWGACGDYREFAQTMAAREQSRDEPFRIKAYFAETDALIGRKGQKYFEECWSGPGVEGVEFVSTRLDGTDHDTLSQSVEVWEHILSFVQ